MLDIHIELPFLLHLCPMSVPTLFLSLLFLLLFDVVVVVPPLSVSVPLSLPLVHLAQCVAAKVLVLVMVEEVGAFVTLGCVFALV